MIADSGALFAETSEAVFLVNHKGVIRFASPGAAQYYGYEPGDLVGQGMERFVAPEDQEALRQCWDAFVNDLERSSEEITLTVLAAQEHRVRLRISIWRLPDPQRFLLIHHVLAPIRERLESLYSILGTLSAPPNADVMLDKVLGAALRLIPSATGTLLLYDDTGKLRLTRSYTYPNADMIAAVNERLDDFETIDILRTTGKALIINDCANDPRWVEVPGTEHVKSWLGVPLIYRGEFMGFLNLDGAYPCAFIPDDAELMSVFASQLAAVLYGARRYGEEAQRARQFEALYEIGLAINDLELDSVLEVVYRRISSLMETTSFFIGLYDAEAGQVRIAGGYEHGKRQVDRIQGVDQGIVGLVLRTGQSIIIHDSQTQPMPSESIIDGETPRSVLMFPLVVQEQVVGVLSVQSYQPYTYGLDDIALLKFIAGAVAIAIQNAQLYDETANRLAALGTLHRTALQLASVQDPDQVARLILDAVLDLFQPTQVRLYLADCATWESMLWIGKPGRPPQIEGMRGQEPDALIQEVMRTGQRLIVPDLDSRPDRQAGFDTVPQSAAAYAIMGGGAAAGVLVLLYATPQVFRRDMQRTLELLCLQAATVLENVRYFFTLRRRFEEVTALHELAREVSTCRSLDDIMLTVVNRLRDVFQCRAAAVGLLDQKSQEVVLRASAGLDAQYMEAGRFKMGEYVAGQVVETGEIIYVTDTHHDPHFRFVDPDVRSLLVVPLKVQDYVIGVLSVDSAVPNGFTPDHERVLTIVGGQIAAAIETVRLLEETRDRAAQLDEANANLKALDDLRNELVQNLSHELRSPLALVRGYAGLLRDGELGPLVKDQVDAIDVIDAKAESISRLINDILALEAIRRESLELGPVDIIRLCQQAMDGAQLLFAERGLTFEAECSVESLILEGDSVRLNQVLDNLIGNAAKFSPDGSLITLRAAVDPQGQCVRVSVIDRGIGIPAEKLPHIFERFFQGDRSIKYRYGGAGLGLAIVRQIIEAHDGKISVESGEGVGSTFTFELPLVEKETDGVV